MDKRIQVLGMSQYFVCVIYDVLNDTEQIEFLDIFLNIEVEALPQMPNINFPFKIHEVGNYPENNVPVVFGVSGPKNKYPIFKHFMDAPQLKMEQFKKVIHHSSYISKSTVIGFGCFIEQNVTISSQTKLGFGITIKRGVSIGHHCDVGDFVDINPGAIIAGKVILGKGSVIGAGATVLDGITIGENSIIGAGSLVTKNIPSGVVAYGNPCKVIRANSDLKLD